MHSKNVFVLVLAHLEPELECNEAKRPVYGSEGVDLGVARGSRGHPRDPMGSQGWFDESFPDS